MACRRSIDEIKTSDNGLFNGGDFWLVTRPSNEQSRSPEGGTVRDNVATHAMYVTPLEILQSM